MQLARKITCALVHMLIDGIPLVFLLIVLCLSMAGEEPWWNGPDWQGEDVADTGGAKGHPGDAGGGARRRWPHISRDWPHRNSASQDLKLSRAKVCMYYVAINLLCTQRSLPILPRGDIFVCVLFLCELCESIAGHVKFYCINIYHAIHCVMLECMNINHVNFSRVLF